MALLDALGHALELTFAMTWEITWALILGFFLSAIVQALVRRQTITELLGDDRARTLAVAAGLVVRFVRTGGMAMLRMMGGGADNTDQDRDGRPHENQANQGANGSNADGVAGGEHGSAPGHERP
jgi:hypothetical protein